MNILKKKNGKNNLIRAYLIMLLGVLLFAGIFTLSDLPIVTIFLISVISVFFLSIVFFSKNIFNPFNFFFIYTFLGFIDITMVASGVRNGLYDVPNYIYNKSLFIMLIWLVTFTLGYLCVVKITIKVKHFRNLDNEQENDIYPWVIFTLCCVVFSFSFLSTLKNSLKLGGLVEGMSGGGEAFADQGYLLALLGFAGCLPVLALYSGKKIRAVIYALLVFISIVITGRRSMAILTAFLPLCVYWNSKVKKIKLLNIAIIAVPLLIIIMYVGAIRTADNPSFSETYTDNYFVSQLAILARYNGYGDNIPLMISKIDSGALDFQKFEYIYRGVQYYIPRNLWPEKPLVHSAQIVSNSVFFKGDTGRPVNAYGWAYFNFGYVGVILSGFFTGIIVSYFYKIVQKRKSVMLLCMYALLILPVLEIFQPEAQMKILLFTVTLKMLEIISRKNKKSRANFWGDNSERYN
ncbi:O-antigen polysaccharide polymerase Wzy [Bacillus sp. FJAT-42376]|uniref:O-antigen polymerase n=1 Tax=Bacillus sp. FJAT-42376 TaxID=2014076 RepID=UPI000F4F1B02|nr:O-antigen polymerase [Bacillus sp. FJAT-42376]AZB44665.1 O-antigen polysaccharide polymerase Wzy [Bacillus sp. FJAT-42376]